jgi:hypothetical protein
MAKQYADAFRAEVLGPGSTVSTLLDIGRVRTMFEQHCAAQQDHAYALWAIWMLERWSRVARTRPTTPEFQSPLEARA